MMLRCHELVINHPIKLLDEDGNMSCAFRVMENPVFKDKFRICVAASDKEGLDVSAEIPFYYNGYFLKIYKTNADTVCIKEINDPNEK